MLFCFKKQKPSGAIAGEVTQDFFSGVPTAHADTDAIDFIFDEAEKKLKATLTGIEVLNKRAAAYSNYVGAGIGAAFSLLGFLYANQREAFDFFLHPVVYCLAFFLAALAYCFMTMNLVTVGDIGSDPRYVMTPGYLKTGYKGKQKHYLKFRTAEFYQTLIDINTAVIARKAQKLRTAYVLIWCGLALLCGLTILSS